MRIYSAEEEQTHIWSHAIGTMLSLIFVFVLLNRAKISDVESARIGVLAFSLSVFIMFLVSTLYHASKEPETKKRLRKLDHISIYFLIAGTYTPFIIRYYSDPFGKWFVIVLWAMVVFGTLFKLFFTGRWKILSVAIYLLMGWSGIFVYEDLFLQMPQLVFQLVCLGGLLYTAGVVFYLWDGLKYNHFIWHLFVLGAVVCHAFGVYFGYFY